VGLVHIVEPTIMPVSTGTDPLLGSPMQGLESMEIINMQTDLADTLINKTIKKYGGQLQVTQFNEYGNTADGIINCSKEFKADMIVIGTHSRTGIDRFLMGSVAEHVVRYADVPVLVVPFKENN
jgi:nucleotide-binding universal stress UspA family protein